MIFETRRQALDCRRRVFVMGILNVTPDSFSEQGDNFAPEDARQSARAMLAAGADILDLGGESTRPGAEAVSEAEELRRVLPVLQALRAETDALLSVDTWKSGVARAALAAGADLVNDVSGGVRDPEMYATVARAGAGYVLMHMRGTPATMQQHTDYADLFGEIDDYFQERLAAAAADGLRRERICLDPGIGFSKTVDQNLALIRGLGRFGRHGRPLLLGPSRKSFIGKLLSLDDPRDREWGTAAASACGIAHGARILRVHDVAAMRQVADLAWAIESAGTDIPAMD